MSAAGGGDCDDGLSSGCRKSCVLRKKPARRPPVQNRSNSIAILAAEFEITHGEIFRFSNE